MARTSEVQRDARIGEAAARMATTIKEAIAGEELMKSKLTNDTEIARLDSGGPILGRAGAILLVFLATSAPEVLSFSPPTEERIKIYGKSFY